MSWYCKYTGRASVLAERAVALFEKTDGCPPDTAEAVAKNKCGEIVATLAASMIDANAVLHVEASGSAWTDGNGARAQQISLKLETIGDFVD